MRGLRSGTLVIALAALVGCGTLAAVRRRR